MHKRDDGGFRGIWLNFFRKVGGFRGSGMECYLNFFYDTFLHEVVVECQQGVNVYYTFEIGNNYYTDCLNKLQRERYWFCQSKKIVIVIVIFAI